MADINPLDPNAAQLMDISQQRKLADLLTQQGMQAPQGQMVSGQYVKSSPLQYLANMANMYVGQKTNEAANKQALDYAKAIREAGATESGNIMQALKGTPAQMYEQQAGPTQAGGNIPQQMQTPAVAGSREAAYAQALRGVTPVSQGMAGILQKQLMAEPQWKEVSQYNPKTGNTETFVIDTNSPQPETTKRFVGVSKPEMTASERAHLGIAYANAADQGISGYGGAPRTVSQGSPVLAKPPMSLAPNAPSYAQGAISMPQANSGYALVQDFNKSLMPPAGLAPKAQREWNVEASKPLTGEPAKQVTGAVNTIGAIDNYSKILSDYSKLSSLSPEQRTNLSAAYNTMVLQSKEANALGVLNGQDYEILKSLAPNPNDLKNLLVSNDVLKQQAQKQRDFMGNVVVNAYGIHQKKIPDYVASKIKPLEEAPKIKATSVPAIYASNGSQRIMSDDGGQTWKPVGAK